MTQFNAAEIKLMPCFQKIKFKITRRKNASYSISLYIFLSIAMRLNQEWVNINLFLTFKNIWSIWFARTFIVCPVVVFFVYLYDLHKYSLMCPDTHYTVIILEECRKQTQFDQPTPRSKFIEHFSCKNSDFVYKFSGLFVLLIILCVFLDSPR